jgi:hypothetical protein
MAAEHRTQAQIHLQRVNIQPRIGLNFALLQMDWILIMTDGFFIAKFIFAEIPLWSVSDNIF